MNIFAHRGTSGTHPENTLAAFRNAAQLPIYGVELDVHLTKDHHIVVHHDESINRTSSGSGFIKDLTLAELKQYDFGKKFDQQFVGERIPTLEEVLDVYQNTHHILNIELKSNVFDYESLEEKVLTVIHAYGFQDRVMFSSFNHEALKRIKHLAPEMETAPLFLNKMKKEPLTYIDDLQADAIHLSLRLLKKINIATFHQQQKKVRVFTINQLEQFNELQQLGIDAIFTDYPKELQEYVDEINGFQNN